MHQCPKLLGLIAPMVRVGTTARILLHEREAYVGKTHVQTTPERGRPVMSMETQYADGRNDLIVYAPLAVTKRR